MVTKNGPESARIMRKNPTPSPRTMLEYQSVPAHRTTYSCYLTVTVSVSVCKKGKKVRKKLTLDIYCSALTDRQEDSWTRTVQLLYSYWLETRLLYQNTDQWEGSAHAAAAFLLVRNRPYISCTKINNLSLMQGKMCYLYTNIFSECYKNTYFMIAEVQFLKHFLKSTAPRSHPMSILIPRLT